MNGFQVTCKTMNNSLASKEKNLLLASLQRSPTSIRTRTNHIYKIWLMLSTPSQDYLQTTDSYSALPRTHWWRGCDFLGVAKSILAPPG